MNRLSTELQRLYGTQPAGDAGSAVAEGGLVDGQGQVRAMVLALSRPADWAALCKVWQGVQLDLALPAPAIAVDGQGGYQLWFSLAQALPAATAAAFLDGLRLRYLADLAPQRVAVWPAADPDAAPPWQHARQVPAPQAVGGPWSAFVAPDLAPVFADEPWLDLPPNPDGQASLLAALHSMPALDFAQAQARLAPAAPAPSPPQAPDGATGPAADPSAAGRHTAGGGPTTDPRQFLLSVMNDDQVALGLRIEAAKALLPFLDRQTPG